MHGTQNHFNVSRQSIEHMCICMRRSMFSLNISSILSAIRLSFFFLLSSFFKWIFDVLHFLDIAQYFECIRTISIDEVMATI